MGFGGGSGVSPSVWVFPFQVFQYRTVFLLDSGPGGGRTSSCGALASNSQVAEGQGPRDVTCFRRFKFYRWHPDDGIFTARVSDIS